MANTYILKISDGTNTTDFLADSQRVRYAGLNMPMPKVNEDYIESHFVDGARLAHAHFGNRQIDIDLRIYGSTQAQLRTNIEQIERYLNDAEKHTLLGYGSQVYLEYNWGTTTTESVYFDVLRGNLTMPSDYLNHALNQNYILNAQLSLTCKPFARYSNQTLTTATTGNTGSTANYQDITTSSTYGDVPALMSINLTPASTSGTKTLWIGKRSGDRQTDDLWYEGEEASGYTDCGASTGFVTTAAINPDAVCSNQNNYYFNYHAVSSSCLGNLSYMSIPIAPVPRGKFRVLLRCKFGSKSIGEVATLAASFGWTYGNKSYIPSYAAGDYHHPSADSTWQIMDIGELQLPPVGESDMVANASTMNLNIYYCTATSALTTMGNGWYFYNDYIFLLPIDEGACLIYSTPSSKILTVDNISKDPKYPAVYVLNSSSNIYDYLNYDGAPFNLGRESTRIYYLRDDGITASFTAVVTYQPRFLVI